MKSKLIVRFFKISRMRNFVTIVIVCSLIGIVILSVKVAALEKEAPDVSITLVVDESLFNQDEKIFAAWLGYGLVRKKWIREHVSLKNGESYTYRRSFNEEVEGRESLAKTWEELNADGPQQKDVYLDALLSVLKAGFIREYVWVYLRDDTWNTPPEGLQLPEFAKWQSTNLAGHNPKTLIGIELEKKQ